MDAKNKTYFVVASGLFCSVLGSVLAGLTVTLIRAAQVSPTDLLGSFKLFPLVVLFAAIPGAPFGFIAGSIGAWWLMHRLTSGISKKRFYIEALVLGAGLGATLPVVLSTSGWGPFANLVSALPISILVGSMCGIAFAFFVRKYLTTRAHVF